MVEDQLRETDREVRDIFSEIDLFSAVTPLNEIGERKVSGRNDSII